MGLQELPQFNQQYGKDTAATITSVAGNVLAGSVGNKETLDWLERLFGKNKHPKVLDRTKDFDQLPALQVRPLQSFVEAVTGQ